MFWNSRKRKQRIFWLKTQVPRTEHAEVDDKNREVKQWFDKEIGKGKQW